MRYEPCAPGAHISVAETELLSGLERSDTNLLRKPAARLASVPSRVHQVPTYPEPKLNC